MVSMVPAQGSYTYGGSSSSSSLAERVCAFSEELPAYRPFLGSRSLGRPLRQTAEQPGMTLIPPISSTLVLCALTARRQMRQGRHMLGARGFVSRMRLRAALSDDMQQLRRLLLGLPLDTVNPTSQAGAEQEEEHVATAVVLKLEAEETVEQVSLETAANQTRLAAELTKSEHEDSSAVQSPPVEYADTPRQEELTVLKELRVCVEELFKAFTDKTAAISSADLLAFPELRDFFGRCFPKAGGDVEKTACFQRTGTSVWATSVGKVRAEGDFCLKVHIFNEPGNIGIIKCTESLDEKSWNAYYSGALLQGLVVYDVVQRGQDVLSFLKMEPTLLELSSSVRPGALMKGRVVDNSTEGVVVDIGERSQAFIPASRIDKRLSDYPKGRELLVRVLYVSVPLQTVFVREAADEAATSNGESDATAPPRLPQVGSHVRARLLPEDGSLRLHRVASEFRDQPAILAAGSAFPEGVETPNFKVVDYEGMGAETKAVLEPTKAEKTWQPQIGELLECRVLGVCRVGLLLEAGGGYYGLMRLRNAQRPLEGYVPGSRLKVRVLRIQQAARRLDVREYLPALGEVPSQPEEGERLPSVGELVEGIIIGVEEVLCGGDDRRITLVVGLSHLPNAVGILEGISSDFELRYPLGTRIRGLRVTDLFAKPPNAVRQSAVYAVLEFSRDHASQFSPRIVIGRVLPGRVHRVLPSGDVLMNVGEKTAAIMLRSDHHRQRGAGSKDSPYAVGDKFAVVVIAHDADASVGSKQKGMIRVREKLDAEEREWQAATLPPLPQAGAVVRGRVLEDDNPYAMSYSGEDLGLCIEITGSCFLGERKHGLCGIVMGSYVHGGKKRYPPGKELSDLKVVDVGFANGLGWVNLKLPRMELRKGEASVGDRLDGVVWKVFDDIGVRFDVGLQLDGARLSGLCRWRDLPSPRDQYSAGRKIEGLRIIDINLDAEPAEVNLSTRAWRPPPPLPLEVGTVVTALVLEEWPLRGLLLDLGGDLIGWAPAHALKERTDMYRVGETSLTVTLVELADPSREFWAATVSEFPKDAEAWDDINTHKVSRLFSTSVGPGAILRGKVVDRAKFGVFFDFGHKARCLMRSSSLPRSKEPDDYELGETRLLMALSVNDAAEVLVRELREEELGEVQLARDDDRMSETLPTTDSDETTEQMVFEGSLGVLPSSPLGLPAVGQEVAGVLMDEAQSPAWLAAGDTGSEQRLSLKLNDSDIYAGIISRNVAWIAPGAVVNNAEVVDITKRNGHFLPLVKIRRWRTEDLDIGQKVSGKIIGDNDYGVVIDVGAKDPGVLPMAHFPQDCTHLAVGNYIADLQVYALCPVRDVMPLLLSVGIDGGIPDARKLQNGQILTGTVATLSSYGVFFDVGHSQLLLCHLYDMVGTIDSYKIGDVREGLLVAWKDGQPKPNLLEMDGYGTPAEQQNSAVGVTIGQAITGQVVSILPYGFILSVPEISRDAFLSTEQRAATGATAGSYAVGDVVEGLWVKAVPELGEIEVTLTELQRS
eukprot:TRINITY_DN33934_c0_g1_i1.p1 TRINITY_DN33934_c0_g1~~TRINITY_DN33934_c0_g1_i1.p1  ORF type:complete len:1506 (+),score=197.96 TRINITY_DN33934_c0_g1_i1:63-4580(+)